MGYSAFASPFMQGAIFGDWKARLPGASRSIRALIRERIVLLSIYLLPTSDLAIVDQYGLAQTTFAMIVWASS